MVIKSKEKSTKIAKIDKMDKNLRSKKNHDSCLVITRIVKDYQMGKITVRALDHTDLKIPFQKLVVILGPSGSGKTTLLNMIGALDTVTQGEIQVLNQNITSLNRKELAKFRRDHLGFIFQFFNLIPSLTALENVEYALQIRGEKKSKKKAEETLEKVGLSNRANHFPTELSGGEQQRVAIARALAKSPELLLADEPTGELDYETGIKILQLLRDVVDSGKTVLIVTHNSEIAKIADTVLHLQGGKIVSQEANDNPIDPKDLKW